MYQHAIGIRFFKFAKNVTWDESANGDVRTGWAVCGVTRRYEILAIGQWELVKHIWLTAISKDHWR